MGTLDNNLTTGKFDTVDNSHICLTDNDYHNYFDNIKNMYELFNNDYASFRKNFENDVKMYSYLMKLASNFVNDVDEAMKAEPVDNPNEKKYWVYEYCNKMHDIPAIRWGEGVKLKPDDGARLYKQLKEAKLDVDNARSKYRAEKSYSEKKNPYHHLKGEGNIFDELSELLKKGNKVCRGCSDEYKEIQKQIKQLKNEIKDMGEGLETSRENKRYVQVCLKSILEKANQYIDSRKNVALNYSQGSYKGKRVDIMKVVANAIEARIKFSEKCSMYSPEDKNMEFGKEYRAKIANKLKNGTFSSTLYSEYIASRSAVNANEEQKKDMCSFISAKSQEVLENKAVTTLKNAFKGQKIDVSTANKYASFAEKQIKDLNNDLNSHEYDMTEIAKKMTNTNEKIKNAKESINLQFLDDMIFEPELGNRNFEIALLETKRGIMSEKMSVAAVSKKNTAKVEKPATVNEPIMSA